MPKCLDFLHDIDNSEIINDNINVYLRISCVAFNYAALHCILPAYKISDLKSSSFRNNNNYKRGSSTKAQQQHKAQNQNTKQQHTHTSVFVV